MDYYYWWIKQIFCCCSCWEGAKFDNFIAGFSDVVFHLDSYLEKCRNFVSLLFII